MELILEVVSSERFMLGDNATHRFLPAGGVIGRSSGCDWTIPDQTRHLSGRHAIISYEAGQFFITDISTNGIYLNGPDPLPRNVAVPLQDEDRVTMGEHQFRVRIQMDVRGGPSAPVNRPVAVAAPPLGQGGLNAQDNPMAALDAFLADRQQQDVAAGQAQDWHAKSGSMPDHLRPEQEVFVPPRLVAEVPSVHVAGAAPDPGLLPDNWMDLSIVPAVPRGTDSRQDVAAMPTVEKPAQARVPPIPQPGRRTAGAPPAAPGMDRPPPPVEQPRPVAGIAPPGASVQAEATIAAFAQGLGVTPDDIRQAGGDAFVRRAGALLRQCLQGMVSSAHARASLKNEFRLDMTLVNPRGNNPIKFSAHGDQVVRHLLNGESGSFLSVEEAVAECNEDFQHHQLAMMAGMQQAFLELIQQLSPDELERRFERLKPRGLSFTGKGSRYWEAYRELHQELQEEDDIFASMFVEPFARAYDEQIRKLKQNSKKKEQ